MEKKITFNELRKIKDSLPDGAIRKKWRKSLKYQKKPSGIILEARTTQTEELLESIWSRDQTAELFSSTIRKF